MVLKDHEKHFICACVLVNRLFFSFINVNKNSFFYVPVYFYICNISYLYRILKRLKMEKLNSSGLARTKSDQSMVETVAAAFKSPTSSETVAGAAAESGGVLSRKSSRRMMVASPGRSGSSSRNTHIRKSRSAQMKLDFDEVSSGAALSRASSASLGFSFSFTGFTVPPDEIADSKPFSDDDIRESFIISSFFLSQH